MKTTRSTSVCRGVAPSTRPLRLGTAALVARDGEGRDEYSSGAGMVRGGRRGVPRGRAQPACSPDELRKYRLSGPGAEALLDRLCANALPREPGLIALTQMCRPAGGIECDLTVTRDEQDRFYLVSAAATELHDYAWIEAHLPDDGSVHLENVTDRYGVLTLAGPFARALQRRRQPTSPARRSPFPRPSARIVKTGVDAARIISRGQLRAAPSARHHGAVDLLLAAGEPLGLVASATGARSRDSRRPTGCGRGHVPPIHPARGGPQASCASTRGFIGREALLRPAGEGIGRGSLPPIETDGADPPATSPSWRRPADRLRGLRRYGPWRASIASHTCVESEPGTELEVEIRGGRSSAVVRKPLYDPQNERVLS